MKWNYILLGLAILLVSHDGFALERGECRSTKKQEVIISCIDIGVYDPCEDAGGSWGAAQCGWAHAEIASRRIKQLEKRILVSIKQNHMKSDTSKTFESSMVSWIRYRDTYCDFTNKADDLPNFGGMALHLSFCKRRLNEQKVIELEKIVSHIDNL